MSVVDRPRDGAVDLTALLVPLKECGPSQSTPWIERWRDRRRTPPKTEPRPIGRSTVILLWRPTNPQRREREADGVAIEEHTPQIPSETEIGIIGQNDGTAGQPRPSVVVVFTRACVTRRTRNPLTAMGPESPIIRGSGCKMTCPCEAGTHAACCVCPQHGYSVCARLIRVRIT